MSMCCVGEVTCFVLVTLHMQVLVGGINCCVGVASIVFLTTRNSCCVQKCIHDTQGKNPSKSIFEVDIWEAMNKASNKYIQFIRKVDIKKFIAIENLAHGLEFLKEV